MLLVPMHHILFMTVFTFIVLGNAVSILTRFPSCYFVDIIRRISIIRMSTISTSISLWYSSRGLLLISSAIAHFLSGQSPFFLETKPAWLSFYFPWLVPVRTLTFRTNYRITFGSRTRNPNMPTSFTLISFKGYLTHLQITTQNMYLSIRCDLIGKFI